MDGEGDSGEQLVSWLAALASPHRLRIVAALLQGRDHVSQLARQLEMSRPLLHMHLQRLEAVGIVSGTLELSKEGKAMKYFEVEPFDLHLTPQRIAEVVATGTMASPRRGQDEQ